MKKIIFLSICIFLASLGLFGYKYYQETLNTQQKVRQNKILSKQLKEVPTSQEVKTIISDPIVKTQDEKIETLKKRFSLRGTIARGDSFTQSNQPILALNEYSKALRQNPKDEQIIKKLAGTYFELKRYGNAVEQFSKIESYLHPEEVNSYILSLLYLTNYNSPENVKITLDKMNTLPMSDEERFYYTTIINATQDFHVTKKTFDDYINSHPNITFSGLISIKNALTNFNNFQTKDLYYKDALIIGAIFQQKLFSISNVLAEKLLVQKPNYKPMLLVIGKGYYELGDLENAKKYLQTYYTLEPTDKNITYILGTIHFKLKDYVTSNLYYNAALKNGFEPKIELQRKLVYNYYLNSDTRSMLNMFSFLLNEDASTIDDYSLGIYHAILEGRTLDAKNRSEKGLAKFGGQPGYEIFYAYLGWISREAKDFQTSRNYLSQGLKINSKNPLLTLNMGYLEEYEEQYTLALIYLKRTVNLNEDGEFGELARREIDEIEKYLAITQKSNTSSGAKQ